MIRLESLIAMCRRVPLSPGDWDTFSRLACERRVTALGLCQMSFGSCDVAI